MMVTISSVTVTMTVMMFERNARQLVDCCTMMSTRTSCSCGSTCSCSSHAHAHAQVMNRLFFCLILFQLETKWNGMGNRMID